MTTVLPRLVRRLLPVAVATLVAGPTALLAPAPAWSAAGTGSVPVPAALPEGACAELDLDDEAAVVERAEAVDDVFVGRVDAVVRRSGASPALRRVVAHRVTVTTVLSGDLRLGQKVTLVFAPSETGRNRLLGQRESHLFFTRDQDGELRADYCGGSKELPGGLSAALQRRLEEYLRAAPAPPARVELRPAEGAGGEPPRLGRLVAPGAAISLVGLLGLVLVLRLGRRR